MKMPQDVKFIIICMVLSFSLFQSFLAEESHMPFPTLTNNCNSYVSEVESNDRCHTRGKEENNISDTLRDIFSLSSHWLNESSITESQFQHGVTWLTRAENYSKGNSSLLQSIYANFISDLFWLHRSGSLDPYLYREMSLRSEATDYGLSIGLGKEWVVVFTFNDDTWSFYKSIGACYNPLFAASHLFYIIDDGNLQLLGRGLDRLLSHSRVYERDNRTLRSWPYLFNHSKWDQVAPWSSALAQARILKLLGMSYSITGNRTYLSAAGSTLQTFYLNWWEGGIKEPGDFGPWYAECPSNHSHRILNGYTTALRDLYLYYEMTNDTRALERFQLSIPELIGHIHRYDTGRWSYYSLKDGKLASGSYHDIHINNLYLLANWASSPRLKYYADLFENYRSPLPIVDRSPRYMAYTLTPPEISACFDSAQLDPESITAKLNGMDVTFLCNITNGCLKYYLKGLEPGVYNVSLAASLLFDPSTMYYANWTFKYYPLEAEAGPDVTVNAGVKVYFNGNASIFTPSIVNFTWQIDFDDPLELYGPSVSHSFMELDIFIVNLRLTDEVGNADEDSFQVTVIDEIAPIARAGDDIFSEQHVSVVFNGTQSEDNLAVFNYSWSFSYDGRDVRIFGPNPVFIFNIAGPFLVCLNVSDEQGNWAVDFLMVTVKDITPPIADAGADVFMGQHEKLFLNASRCSDNVGIVNFTWVLEYGGAVIFFYSQEAEFLFSQAGNYRVVLNVSDAAGNYDEDAFMVAVRDITPPVADAGDDILILQGASAMLYARNSSDNMGIINYTWSFILDGSNVLLYGKMLFYEFIVTGFYNISLVVTDAEGNHDRDTLIVLVEAEKGFDADGDGWNDSVERAAGTDPYSLFSYPSDLDGDGTPDVMDDDIDGDGWSNIIELQEGTGHENRLSYPFDLDGDWIADHMDDDIDGDGIENAWDHFPYDAGRYEKPSGTKRDFHWIIIVLVIGTIVIMIGVVFFLTSEKNISRNM